MVINTAVTLREALEKIGKDKMICVGHRGTGGYFFAGSNNTNDIYESFLENRAEILEDYTKGIDSYNELAKLKVLTANIPGTIDALYELENEVDKQILNARNADVITRINTLEELLNTKCFVHSDANVPGFVPELEVYMVNLLDGIQDRRDKYMYCITEDWEEI